MGSRNLESCIFRAGRLSTCGHLGGRGGGKGKTWVSVDGMREFLVGREVSQPEEEQVGRRLNRKCPRFVGREDPRV